ncbi:hypothetical protein PR048_023651 [Dryococelus australis]|uniref:Uncharacterized protein n=1 Tax=Dryococelus australis TaxID=614101 RepID=A0ABQ9GUQ7_9NEOP|nr:hypothetical protein PR048_023651 [Dryococelus australis]
MGPQFRGYATTHHLTICHPREPTYVPYAQNRHPQVLDFSVARPGITFRKVKVYYTGTSDHFPMSSKLECIPNAVDIKPRYDFANADWLQFRAQINAEVDLTVHFNTPQDLEKAVTALTELVSSA